MRRAVGVELFPAALDRRLDELRGRHDAPSRTERRRLKVDLRRWQKDLTVALRSKSPSERRAESEARWRVRFRTRAELDAAIGETDRRLMADEGSREEFLALVACRESARVLRDRLDAGRAIVDGGAEARAFRERCRLPGWFADKDAEALVSEGEWALARFDEMDAGLRSWIARNVARELFYELRTAELETLIGIGRLGGVERVAEEAMDALLTPLSPPSLRALSSLIAEARDVAEGPGNPSKRRRFRARELRLLRRLRRHSLLPCDPSTLEPWVRRERDLQRAACEAYTVWRVLCRRPDDAGLRARLESLLEGVPQFTAGWPFGEELLRAGAFLERLDIRRERAS